MNTATQVTPTFVPTATAKKAEAGTKIEQPLLTAERATALIKNIQALVNQRKNARKSAETSGKPFTDMVTVKVNGKNESMTRKSVIEKEIKAAMNEGLTFGHMLPGYASAYARGTFENGQVVGLTVSTSGNIQAFGTFQDSTAIVGNNSAYVSPVRRCSLFALFLTFEGDINKAITESAYLKAVSFTVDRKEVSAIKKAVAAMLASDVTSAIDKAVDGSIDKVQGRETGLALIATESARASFLRSGITAHKQVVRANTKAEKAAK